MPVPARTAQRISRPTLRPWRRPSGKGRGKSYTGRPLRADVPIGGSTYSREPFPKQVEELRESGFDYAELDLTWLTWEPTKLAAEAEALAKRLPLFTAHLPPSHFHQADLARFVGFIDVLEPVGIHLFNAHFMEARSAPRISPATNICRSERERSISSEMRRR